MLKGERKRRQKKHTRRTEDTRARRNQDGGGSRASRGEAKAVSRPRSWAPDTVFRVSVR